jgi:hypothetical protein
MKACSLNSASSTLSRAASGADFPHLDVRMAAQRRQAQQADIDPAFLDFQRLVFRRQHRDVQRHAGMLVQCDRECLADARRQYHRAGMLQSDHALRAFADMARLHQRIVDVFQDALAALVEQLAGRRQLELAGVARQQRRLQLVLQLLDLPAQRRLRDVQLFGSA